MRRFVKLASAVLGAGFLIYVIWIATFLIGFLYASSKMEEIVRDDATRIFVEQNKGFLTSRIVEPSFLGGYQTVFPEMVANPDNTFVAYSLFGAGFTIIYDVDGAVLAVIDNGLDG